jgi:hypothetical protein
MQNQLTRNWEDTNQNGYDTQHEWTISGYQKLGWIIDQMDEDDFGWSLKRILDEAETGLSSPNSWRMKTKKFAKLRNFYALMLFLCELWKGRRYSILWDSVQLERYKSSIGAYFGKHCFDELMAVPEKKHREKHLEETRNILARLWFLQRSYGI